MMPEKQDEKLKKLVMSRQSKLETDKSGFNDRMQEVADYVCPHRDDILGNARTKGDKKGRKIYDGTAVSAAVIATDGIHGYHVSPAFPWFKYSMNRKEVNRVPEVRQWLQELEFNMYTALNRSNFYSEMWPFIYDGFTLGTAPIVAEEDLVEKRIVFEAVHPGESFIAENKYGDVDVMHRKRRMTARQLVQMFGKENVTDPVKQAYENHPFQEFEVIHAVFPREEYDDRKMDGKSKRFASVWLLTAGNHVMRESGFDIFPYHVWRYIRTGKDVYGLSPAHLAMADILGVNLMAKTLLGAAQLHVDPAYNVPAYLEGKVDLRPRGFNYTRGNDRISPISNTGQFPVGTDREQAKQRSIKERFHVDTFLMLANLAGQGQRTAYEVSEMMAEKAAVLGAELGPLNTELDHILDRVYEIEVAAGRMPDPPEILLEMAAKDPHLRFDPVYMGPLAKAQRERFSMDGLRKFLTVDFPMMVQLDPTVADNVDMDQVCRVSMENADVPFEIVKSEADRDEFRQQKAAAQQQEATKAATLEAAPAIRDVAAADASTGGMLTDMLGMGGGNAPA